MKWLGRRGSGNIEDRRGFSGGGVAMGGGIVGLIVYLLVSFVGGGEGLNLGGGLDSQEGSAEGVVATGNNPEDQAAQFASVMLADNEDVWNKIFAEKGSDYREPVMVLYRDATSSACGSANSAVGPFYCPADEKVYLDLSFFDDLKQRFGAAGDFANAYVIAHEVGHHVQNLLGTSDKVQSAMNSVSKSEAKKLSVALELQADFYAGVWAHYDQKMKNVLDAGDIEEALNAASAIGDDRLQKMSGHEVVPDAFTHGSSEQRMYWFRKGFETGDLAQGNTFEQAR
jgi:predicted metalloprotease